MSDLLTTRQKADNELKSICAMFNAQEIRYCILRLPSFDSVSEFETDILIQPLSFAKLHNVLIHQGFKHYQDDVLTHHHYKRDNIHLDFTTCISFGDKREHYVSAGKEILWRAKENDGMVFISEIDELAMLVMRSMFDKKDFSKKSKRIFNIIDKLGVSKCIKMMSKIYSLEE